MDNCPILGDTILLLCDHQLPNMSFFFGSVDLCDFFPQKYKSSFVWNVRERCWYWDDSFHKYKLTSTAKFFADVSKSMHVIFHPSEEFQSGFLVTEVKLYQALRRSRNWQLWGSFLLKIKIKRKQKNWIFSFFKEKITHLKTVRSFDPRVRL